MVGRGAEAEMADRRISIPLPSSCSGKVDESSFYISPDELTLMFFLFFSVDVEIIFTIKWRMSAYETIVRLS